MSFWVEISKLAKEDYENQDNYIQHTINKIYEMTGITLGYRNIGSKSNYEIYVNTMEPTNVVVSLCMVNGKRNVLRALNGIYRFHHYMNNKEQYLKPKRKVTQKIVYH